MAHILIADDDELIAALVSELLIDAGHACGWVTDGAEAWRLLRKGRRPDLVLMDQDMPGLSGITLLRKLRGSPQLYDLPVVMFTAMSGAQDEEQAIYAGAQDFVRKPFELSHLASRVERVLDKRTKGPRHRDLKTYLAESNGMLPKERPHQRTLL